ncbi:efflux RND transporter periplasmic adaptor subunit [Parapedobacter tibetensis]|uniref:efflux RND transporter periplasmic adaptor subunit n=1 Tax=Parapedobacter tibetensis TaxID=2972951 RepID=UPI00214D26A2|nr:efflux RND transporter periplasmic adaptor subunit [Parapedobacter tibetensis]
MKTNKIIVSHYQWIVVGVVFISFFIFSACSSHSENDGHSHGKNETASNDESGHEENSTIATLTADQMQSIKLSLGEIEQKELTATIKANGRLKVPNANKASITALYGGVIKTLRVDVGTSVKKGSVIATIVHPQFIQLQEEYLTISSRIVFAEQERKRQQELNEGNVGALKNLQNVESELKAQRARKASLFQQLRLMGIDPSTVSPDNLKTELAITSPISGTVSRIFTNLGSYVDVSTPMAEIVENHQLHLDLNVFEKDLPLLKIGQNIHFMLTNIPSKTYDASIFGIGATFEGNSKTIPVHCYVNGDKSDLIDGMNITATISLDKTLSTAVPNGAIVDEGDNAYIFVVTDKSPENHHHADGHDHAEGGEVEHAAASGSMNFERIEVAKGVSEMGYTAITPAVVIPEGTKIVTKGAFFIKAVLSGSTGHSH